MAENPNAQSGAPATDKPKTKRELAIEAQKEQQQIVAAKRVEYLKALFELEEIGGQDDIKASVLEIVNAFPKGIPFPFLTQAVPSATATIRKEMVEEKLIEVTMDGRTATLKPVTAKPTE